MTGTYPAVAYSSQVEPVTTLLGYSGLTTDAVGNLYHLNGPSLFKLAPPYNSTPATVADGFTAAYSVAIDGAGNFYVADPEINTYGEVVKLAPGCTNATAACASVIYAPSSLPGPIGVAVDGLGNVFIAQNQTGVLRFLPMEVHSSRCTTRQVIRWEAWRWMRRAISSLPIAVSTTSWKSRPAAQLPAARQRSALDGLIRKTWRWTPRGT
jgi:hypothetical protein